MTPYGLCRPRTELEREPSFGPYVYPAPIHVLPRFAESAERGA